MAENGCLSYLAFVRDVTADTTTIESVPVVRYFPHMFLADLPGMPPDRDIDYVEFFGNVVSSKGNKVDPKKVGAVQSWPGPSFATEIQSFLGLVGYYRHFVDGFSPSQLL
uniref:Uncharacterized protein n=1 Tax=Nicotiana tabacum TaxID=4097 RepID=A0A1S3ZT07_TOBAC|nr:PREDICTED: uncharacterized protein LOC107790156 [Nicotiana tabacum]XP_033515112.1 uncharacterized protein LOC117279666 [Nicotiana tomentosiformis]